MFQELMLNGCLNSPMQNLSVCHKPHGLHGLSLRLRATRSRKPWSTFYASPAEVFDIFVMDAADRTFHIAGVPVEHGPLSFSSAAATGW